MNEFIRIAAHANPMVDGLDIYIVEKVPHADIDERRIATQIVFETISEFQVSTPPLWITRDNAKRLMDDLWNAGIRPSDLGDAVGALKATQNHLSDMQKLLFDLFNRLNLEHSRSNN